MKPIVPDYYRNNPTGGSLHIVLEDGNVRDKDVQFCLEFALDHKDYAGADLAGILLRMSPAQRRKIHLQAWVY